MFLLAIGPDHPTYRKLKTIELLFPIYVLTIIEKNDRGRPFVILSLSIWGRRYYFETHSTDN